MDSRSNVVSQIQIQLIFTIREIVNANEIRFTKQTTGIYSLCESRTVNDILHNPYIPLNPGLQVKFIYKPQSNSITFSNNITIYASGDNNAEFHSCLGRNVFSLRKYIETHIIQSIELIEQLIYGLYIYIYAGNNNFEILNVRTVKEFFEYTTL